MRTGRSRTSVLALLGLAVLLAGPAGFSGPGLLPVPAAGAPAAGLHLAANGSGPRPTGAPYIPYTLNLLDGANLSGASAGYSLNQPTAAVYDAANGMLYVAAQSSQVIAVVNASTDHVDGAILLSDGGTAPKGAGAGPAPWDLALDNQTGLLYVSHETDFLDVINTTTNTLVRSISFGQEVGGLSIAPARQMLFGADLGNGALDLLSTANDSTIAQIPVGGLPMAAAYDPQTRSVFVSVASNGSVADVNLTSHQVQFWTSVPFTPWGVAVVPSTGGIAVTGCSTTTCGLSLLAPTGGAPVATAYPGDCGALALEIPSLHAIALSNQRSANMTVVNDSTLSTLATIPVAPSGESFGLASDPLAHRLFVTDDALQRVVVVSTTGWTIHAIVPVSDHPVAATYVPSENVLDAVDPTQDVIVSLNLTTGVVTTNHSVGSAPYGIAYDAATGELYVSSVGAGLQAFSPGPLTASTNVTTGANGSGPIAYASGNGHILAIGYGRCSGSPCDAFYDVNASQHSATSVALPGRVGGTEIAYNATLDAAFLALTNGLEVEISLATDQIVQRHGVGSSPSAIAFDPADATVWVANGKSSNVTVLDPTTNRTVANLSTGSSGGPQYVAYDPALDAMVVATSNASANFRFFNASTNAPGTNESLPLLFRGQTGAPNGGMTYLPELRSLAIADAGAVGFLDPVPATLALQSFRATPSITSAGHAAVLAVLAQGGSTNLTYAYHGLPSGCASANTSALSCRPTATGRFHVNVTVTDHAGTSVNGSLVLTVFPALQIGPIAAHGIAARTGEPYLFTLPVAGGVNGDVFNWSGLPPGCPTNGTTWVVCVPNTVGHYSVSAEVTDSEGTNASTGPIAVSVETPLDATFRVLPNTTIDLRQRFTFLVTASGGTLPYTYAWGNLPPGCTGGNFSSLPCTPITSGTYQSFAWVTDLGGYDNVTLPISLVVHLDPVAGPITASSTLLDTGQTLQLNASVRNGTAPYSYVWNGLPAGCPSANLTNLTCQPVGVGSFLVSVTITDSVGVAVTSPVVNVTVDPALGAVLLASNVSATDLGGSVTFSASIASGATPFIYNWTGLPAGCVPADAANITCRPGLAGSWNVSVTVTDPAGVRRTSPSLFFVVHAAVSVGTPITPQTAWDVGQRLTLTVPVGGGSGSYSILWSGLPPGCGSVNRSTLTCLLSGLGVGNWHVRATVIDSLGFTATATPLALSVAPTLQARVAYPGTHLDVGQVLRANLTVTGGSLPIVANWSGLPSGCTVPLPDSTVLACFVVTPGNYSVGVQVSDAALATVVLGPQTIAVSPAPILGTPIVSNGTIDAGQSTTFSVAVLGAGAGGPLLDWQGLPPGCALPGSVATFGCEPTTNGTYQVSVRLSDANGLSVLSPSIVLVVLADPLALVHGPLGPIGLGASANLTVNVTGGAGPYRLSWSGLPSGCPPPGPTARSLNCTPTESGRFTVHVTLTDSLGYTVVSPAFSFEVTPPPTPSNGLSIETIGVIALGAVAAVAAITGVLLSRRRRRPSR